MISFNFYYKLRYLIIQNTHIIIILKYILNRLNHLLSIRSKQKAFHPNATQFTLDLGDIFFGIWRQDNKRIQSIFCIHNISDVEQNFKLSSINLVEGDKWYDLVSKKNIEDIDGNMLFMPYQYMWITNV